MGQPEKRFKVGAVVASVFSNDINTGEGSRLMRSVTLQKTYRDKEGNFRPTNSLNTNDVPKAILALSKAYDFLMSLDGTAR